MLERFDHLLLPKLVIHYHLCKVAILLPSLPLSQKESRLLGVFLELERQLKVDGVFTWWLPLQPILCRGKVGNTVSYLLFFDNILYSPSGPADHRPNRVPYIFGFVDRTYGATEEVKMRPSLPCFSAGTTKSNILCNPYESSMSLTDTL